MFARQPHVRPAQDWTITDVRLLDRYAKILTRGGIVWHLHRIRQGVRFVAFSRSGRVDLGPYALVAWLNDLDGRRIDG